MRKKLKQPSFAAGVHRDEVYAGAELLGLELDEHIANVIAALQPIAAELGLRTAADAALSRDQPSSAATSRSRSSSLVHQPHETRTSPRPGISRTWTPAVVEPCDDVRGLLAVGPEADERRRGRPA